MTTIQQVTDLVPATEVKSWERKCIALQRLLDRLEPLDREMFEAIEKRKPLISEIEELRHQMIQECIHPAEHLIQNDDHVLCKFCNRKLVTVAPDAD